MCATCYTMAENVVEGLGEMEIAQAAPKKVKGEGKSSLKEMNPWPSYIQVCVISNI